MRITFEIQPGKTQILLEGDVSGLSQDETKNLRKQIYGAITGFLGLPGQQAQPQQNGSAEPAQRQNGSTNKELKQQTPPATPPAKTGQFKLAFGKYKGKTIQEVAAEPDGTNYLTWYRDTLIARNQKANLTEKYRQENEAVINAINAQLAAQSQDAASQPPAPPEDLPGLPPEENAGADDAEMSGAEPALDPDLAAIAAQFGGVAPDNNQDPLAPEREKVRQLAAKLGDPNLTKVDQLCLTYFKKKFTEITDQKEMNQLVAGLENAVAQLKK